VIPLRYRDLLAPALWVIRRGLLADRPLFLTKISAYMDITLMQTIT
jgi:hypothetical protein